MNADMTEILEHVYNLNSSLINLQFLLKIRMTGRETFDFFLKSKEKCIKIWANVSWLTSQKINFIIL